MIKLFTLTLSALIVLSSCGKEEVKQSVDERTKEQLLARIGELEEENRILREGATNQDMVNEEVETDIAPVEESGSEPVQATATEAEIGNGNIYIENQSGKSQDGNKIIIFAEESTGLLQISIASEGVDVSKLSYIYVDDKLIDKKQLGDNSLATLSLESPQLTKGTHLVTAKQYDNDEESGTPVLIKNMEYEVK